MIAGFTVIFCYTCTLSRTGQYWNTAPDGFYKMVVYPTGFKDGKIGFAMCEDSPGPLHGYWKVAENVTFPVQGEYILVLVDNTIVYAKFLREWNSTSGTWK
jgi:hypothetical protein